MSLQQELKLPAPFEDTKHEALLNILRTASYISKKGNRFFAGYNLTTAQFNLLMALKYSGARELTQVEIADRLLVNRANVTGIIDRMEKAGLVKRVVDKNDRRHYLVQLTEKGKKIACKVDKKYSEEINKFMRTVSSGDSGEIIRLMEVLRNG